MSALRWSEMSGRRRVVLLMSIIAGAVAYLYLTGEFRVRSTPPDGSRDVETADGKGGRSRGAPGRSATGRNSSPANRSRTLEIVTPRGRAEARFIGRVVDPDGNSIEDVRVFVNVGRTTWERTRTAADGSFALFDEPGSRAEPSEAESSEALATIEVRHSNFERWSAEFQTLDELPKVIELSRGASLQLTVESTTSIDVGNELRALVLVTTQATTVRRTAHLTRDSGGTPWTATMSGFEAGPARVQISLSKLNHVDSTSVEFERDETVIWSVAVGPPRSIAIQVIGLGRPVPDARIEGWIQFSGKGQFPGKGSSRQYQKAFELYTDKKGRVSFDHGSSRLELRIQAFGFAPTRVSGPPEKATVWRIELPDAVGLELTVLDSNGTPLESGWVTLNRIRKAESPESHPADSRTVAHTQSIAKGVVQFRGLPPGLYEPRYSHEGRSTPLEEITIDAPVTTATRSLPAAFVISGRILIDDRATNGGHVTWLNGRDGVRSEVSADGSYSVDLLDSDQPTEYLVIYEPVSELGRPQPQSFSTRKTVHQTQSFDLVFQTTDVAVRVFLPNGNPAAGIEGALGHQRFTTDARGLAELEAFPIGTFFWHFEDPPLGTYAPSRSVDVTIRATVEYQLAAGRELLIAARSEGLEPIFSGLVAYRVGFAETPWQRLTRTESGGYSWPANAGASSLVVEAPGYAASRIAVGGRDRVDCVLVSGARLVLKVTRQGSPASQTPIRAIHVESGTTFDRSTNALGRVSFSFPTGTIRLTADTGADATTREIQLVRDQVIDWDY